MSNSPLMTSNREGTPPLDPPHRRHSFPSPSCSCMRSSPGASKMQKEGSLMRVLAGHSSDILIPNFLMSVSSSIEMPLVTLLGRQYGFQRSSIAQLIALVALSRAVMDIPWGILIDVFDLRRMIISSIIFNIVAAMVGYYFSTRFALILFAIFSGSTLGGFFLNLDVFTARVIPKCYRGTVMSTISGVVRWAHVLGPTLSGVIIAYTGDVRYAFWLSATTAAMTCCSLLFSFRPRRSFPDRERNMLGEDERHFRKREGRGGGREGRRGSAGKWEHYRGGKYHGSRVSTSLEHQGKHFPGPHSPNRMYSHLTCDYSNGDELLRDESVKFPELISATPPPPSSLSPISKENRRKREEDGELGSFSVPSPNNDSASLHASQTKFAAVPFSLPPCVVKYDGGAALSSSTSPSPSPPAILDPGDDLHGNAAVGEKEDSSKPSLLPSSLPLRHGSASCSPSSFSSPPSPHYPDASHSCRHPHQHSPYPPPGHGHRHFSASYASTTPSPAVSGSHRKNRAKKEVLVRSPSFHYGATDWEGGVHKERREQGCASNSPREHPRSSFRLTLLMGLPYRSPTSNFYRGRHGRDACHHHHHHHHHYRCGSTGTTSSSAHHRILQKFLLYYHFSRPSSYPDGLHYKTFSPAYRHPRPLCSALSFSHNRMQKKQRTRYRHHFHGPPPLRVAETAPPSPRFITMSTASPTNATSPVQSHTRSHPSVPPSPSSSSSPLLPPPGFLASLRLHLETIFFLGCYVMFFTGLRANRKLMLTFAGMDSNWSDAQLSFLLSFGFSVDAVLFPLGGIVMDRFGRQWAMVPVTLGYAFSFSLLVFATTAPLLFAASALFGLADSLGCGLIKTLVADRAPLHWGSPFFGIMRMLEDVGHVLGAAGVGRLMHVLGFTRTCFTLSIIGVATALWGILLILPPTEEEEGMEHEDCMSSSSQTSSRSMSTSGSNSVRSSYNRSESSADSGGRDSRRRGSHASTSSFPTSPRSASPFASLTESAPNEAKQKSVAPSPV